MENVIVIGGGIIGLSSAYYLHKAGYKVTVIDKDNFLNNCSYGNAGYVCPSHFIPLAAPGIVKQGIKWMFNSQSPFYVKPALNRPLIDWAWNFMKSANRGNVERSAVPLKNIALLSQHEYEQWSKLPGFDFAYEHKGLLEIFQTDKAADHAHHTVERARELGLDASLLNYSEMQALEPHTKINGQGAIFFKCDAHIYPDNLMKSMLDHLKRSDVQLIPHQNVTRFEHSGSAITKVITTDNTYEASQVVIATGSWSREMAALAGARIPLMPGRGYSVTLADSPYKVNYPAILVEGRVAVTPMDGNKIRFGGTMEVVSVNTPPRYERVKGILSAVKRFYPEFDIPLPKNDNIWFGYRPCSADGLPYIGRIKKYTNVIVATGHSMLGLSLGPATGKLVCELINGQVTSIPMGAFEVERFG